MTGWLRRTLAFSRFALIEYVRSGRILVEAVAVVVAVWILFWPHGTSTGLNVEQLFSLGGLCALALAGYSAAAFAALGNRAAGYVVLVRPLGRGGYLIGLYLAALVTSAVSYCGLTLLSVLVNLAPPLPATLMLTDWLLGSVPLLLDSAIVIAFAFLLTPLVLPFWPRAAILALLALGLSADLRLGIALDIVQNALGYVLLPATLGYSLAVSRAYSSGGLAILGGQLLLLGALLAALLVAFRRRELILS